MFDKWSSGYHVVYGVRKSRKENTDTPKGSQHITNIPFKMAPSSITYGLEGILETTTKNNVGKVRQLEPKGAQ